MILMFLREDKHLFQNNTVLVVVVGTKHILSSKMISIPKKTYLSSSTRIESRNEK